MRALAIFISLLLLGLLPVGSEASSSDLMRDLLTVREIDKRQNDRMPVVYNHLSEGGYIVLPSARVGPDGSVTGTYASVPPYTIYGARLQYMQHLEIVGNYRVFNGVPDPVLSEFGFGDFSDKGANLKVVILAPEDTDYVVPGIAVGLQDFLGTKQFEGQYIVATHVLPKYNLEMSIGVGFGRIGGVYGGALWMPFRGSENDYLQGLTLLVEADPTNYKDKTKEPHPDGRFKKSPINFGLQYRLWDTFDFAVSQVRGMELAYSLGASFPLGTTKGVFTKSKEDPIYTRPINNQRIGVGRPGEAMMHEVLLAFRDQHLTVLEGWMSTASEGKRLIWVRLVNDRYRHEREVRERISKAFSALTPSNIEEIRIVVDNGGLSVHEYRISSDALRRFRQGSIGIYELEILSPLHHPSDQPTEGINLYTSSRTPIDWDLKPRTSTIFGSSRGKFKYAFGFDLGVEGYLPSDIYYRVVVGKTLISDLGAVNDVDMLNPSQIINVRSDSVRYQQNHGLIFDSAYLQKAWHIQDGWYARIAGGWFEQAYGGIGGEILYAPYDLDWAIGVEGAWLMKRKYKGLGFTDSYRKLIGFQPHFETFQPYQFFFNFYYRWPMANMHFKASVGRFLARDYGVRFEATRVFDSGFEVTLFGTRTSARDFVNGERYHDKGIFLSVPLDIFFENSSKDLWEYGLSAWLRDVAAVADTGHPLYTLLREERR